MPFAAANGIRLYYEWHGVESGTPVVLVMGLGGDSTGWPFQLAALGVERAHLVGLSLGGTIAQEAALAAPARVASLQLHSTWAGPHPYLQALVGAVRTVRRELDPESFYRALSVWLFTPECFVRQPELI